jgi:hypothetical protein
MGYRLADRLTGLYLGAALGDAMGAPVEGWRASRIKETHGRVVGFLPYDPARLHPGYALHAEPGSVTDDTYIRSDFARFVLAHPRAEARTAQTLVAFLVEHARFERWWQPPVRLLRRIAAGEVGIDDAARENPQGGGAGWWTPIGLVSAGRPAQAAAEVRRLAAPWKMPLEQRLAGAMQAGAAVATTDGATVEDVIAACRAEAGPLGEQLIDRGLALARAQSGDLDGLIEAVYDQMLVRECATEEDGPLPQFNREPVGAQRDVYSFYAEQLPVALAALAHGGGDFERTLVTVVNIGRDTDSIATTCATWIGGLVGRAGMPAEWVDTLLAANPDVDLLDEARALAALALGETPAPASTATD